MSECVWSVSECVWSVSECVWSVLGSRGYECGGQ